MLFSILIANYNNGHFFHDCYKSIIEQTYTNFEAIIVDDCSTDNSVEQIENIIKADTRFQLYKNDKNYGCGYTKRRCVDLATGEICGFLDPDDLLTSKALEVMINLHRHNEQASLIYSNYVSTNEKLGKKRKMEPHALNSDYLTSSSGYISHFATFKRSLYLKTQGINSKFKRAVDQDLYYKMEEVGTVLYENGYLYLYRVHDGGISVKGNEFAAFSWHLIAMMDACKRRNIDCEKIITTQLCARFGQELKLQKLLTPIREFKTFFINLIRMAKAKKILLILMLMSIVACSEEQDIDSIPKWFPLENGYELIWEDDFVGNEIDKTKWDYRAVGDKRNRATVDSNTVYLDVNGNLVIELSEKNGIFYVGQLSTQNKFLFKYGYFECNVALNKLTGMHSAFWLQSPRIGMGADPSNYGSEIDIFEYIATEPNAIHTTVHWDYADLKNVSKSSQINGINKGFHKMGLEWKPDEYIFYVDNVEIWRTSTAVSQIEEYIILSSEYTRWGGDANPQELPDKVVFDCVRVYSKKQL